MEQVALDRMATSIAQLTLCQVTSEEIETATKLLEKAGQKLRGISDVPPQRIADLDNATRQLHQLSCILDVARSRRAMKSVKYRKHFCYYPALKKDPASSEERFTTSFSTFQVPHDCVIAGFWIASLNL